MFTTQDDIDARKKLDRANAVYWTRSQLLEELASMGLTPADARVGEAAFSMNEKGVRRELEPQGSTKSKRRYTKEAAQLIADAWLRNKAKHEVKQLEKVEREKAFCTRNELVKEARISHSSFDKYLTLGDIVPASEEEGFARVLYERESIARILQRKQSDATSEGEKIAEYYTRLEVMSLCKINELYFSKYVQMGLILVVPDVYVRRKLYLKESVQRVLDYKLSRQRGV
jgi:hypothetical protein